jgi:hypothetical protein
MIIGRSLFVGILAGNRRSTRTGHPLWMPLPQDRAIHACSTGPQ